MMEYWSIGVLDSICQHSITPTGEIIAAFRKRR
jgi:hypothetical protein